MRGVLITQMLLIVVSALVLAGLAIPARNDELPQSSLRKNQQRLLSDPGLALRTAREAAAEGDLHRAEWLLSEVAARHPEIGDYADRDRIRALLAEGEAEAAEKSAVTALANYPDSPLRSTLHGLLGDARAALGREEGARTAWRAALDSTRDEEARAALLVSTGRSQERSGETAGAGETYALLWWLYPNAEQASEAETRLDVIEAETGTVYRTASNWRRRADKLFRKRSNEEALAAYDRALAEGLSASQAERANKQRAHTLFRMRDYPAATKAFAALPQTDDVPIWKARSMARSGQVYEAIEEFEQLAKRVRGEIGLRSVYLAALLLDGRDRTERANAHFETLASSGSGLANASLWHLGWSAYRAGEFTRAVTYFDQLLGKERDPIAKLRPRYWKARALSNGDPWNEAVRAELRGLAADYPLSYYGWRARQRIGEPVPAPPPVDVQPGKRALEPSDLVRPRILLSAGMEDDAREELSRLRRRARGLRDRLDLAQLLSDAGEYHGAQRLVVDAYTETLARGPILNMEELWWYAWPSAYHNLVRNSTRDRDHVDPTLVLSIMREESGYRSRIVSPNGARGLLQIMQETGERLAADVGVEAFTADDLFEPRTNIDLGSHYLGQLNMRFGGRLSAAIASYNAGPMAVSGWVKEEADLADDEWVEAIPYDQTRSYVKRVLRSMEAYRVLY